MSEGAKRKTGLTANAVKHARPREKDYKLSDRFSIYGRVENLFGEDYEEVFSFAAPGRAAYGGVRVSF